MIWLAISWISDIWPFSAKGPKGLQFRSQRLFAACLSAGNMAGNRSDHEAAASHVDLVPEPNHLTRSI